MNGYQKTERKVRVGNHQQSPVQTLKTWTEYNRQRWTHILLGFGVLYSEIARPTAGNPCYTVIITLKCLFFINTFYITFYQ